MGTPVVYSESASPETEPNEQILADLIDDEDGESISGDMSTVSITSSILEYRKHYGRTYENIQSTEYWAPNDAQQNHGLDLTHVGLFFTLDEKLFLAPVEEPKRVLDISTGTGIWAIDFGDEYPEAEVTGTDLSPIQPVVVPPNVKFVIEDCLLDWTWPEDHFDFIHIRAMYGSVPD
ncbi:hypothetical protein H9Q70_000314 [Fusarium xylarioides]|nr:hypothetical protein H9Q70_000314 [Fusarium xylarioides]